MWLKLTNIYCFLFLNVKIINILCKMIKKKRIETDFKKFKLS